MSRKWLIEETGEVRQAKFGEFYLDEMDRINFIVWNASFKTDGEYPILKVTEVERVIVSRTSYPDTYGLIMLRPISLEPEIKGWDEW